MDRIELEVENGLTIEQAEIDNYVTWAKKMHPNATLVGIKILNNEEAELIYKAPPIERIRRITGYLVGTLDRWNDAKRAEEHDRVKHNSVEELE